MTALQDAEPLVVVAAEAALTSAHPGEGRNPGDAAVGAPGMGPGLHRDDREWEITVLLTDDATVQELNARFRGKHAPTNVLSFSAPATAAPHLGDVALAHGVCAREAMAQGKPLAHHLQHLVVHGVLHLLGLDHHADDEAEDMEARERAILLRLGIPDPYAVREPASGPAPPEA